MVVPNITLAKLTFDATLPPFCQFTGENWPYALYCALYLFAWLIFAVLLLWQIGPDALKKFRRTARHSSDSDSASDVSDNV